MNPKIAKLMDERTKNEDKIDSLKARNKEIDQQIKELKGTEILGLVESYSMNVEQLAALLETMKGKPVPGKEAADEEA